MSRRDDAYVRTLLMHSARSIIARSTHLRWITALFERRLYHLVVATLANKLARVAWAVLVKGRAFDKAKWEASAAAMA